MESDPIQLEHQTAPESTRGLFDPPERKPSPPQGASSSPPRAAPPPSSSNSSSSIVDKRRSFNTYAPLLEKSTAPPNKDRPFTRGHQRSRSAVMLTNSGSRKSFGLQPLSEESEDKKVTVDSLQDMINTLKGLPPVMLKENTNGATARSNSISGATNNGSTSSSTSSYSRRLSLGNGISGPDTMQNMVQNTVQELRNIDKSARRRSRRASSMTSTLEASVALRDVALAEAEAKLMGTFAKIEGTSVDQKQGKGQEEVDYDDDDDDDGDEPSIKEMLMSMPRRHSTSRHVGLNEENVAPIRTASRRRYSESSGNSFDMSSLPGAGGKRTSLQQLPTLSENAEMFGSGKGARRLTFNKPLTLEDSNKKISHSRRSSRNLDYDWRSSSVPTLPPLATHQSFNLVPFTPTRVSFAKDDANPHQRRPLFIAHLPFSALPPLFRSRQLVRGILRVNKRNRSDAYVWCEDLDADVYVCGSRDRNRALEGDVVAVRLADVEKVLREKKEKEEAKLVRNGGQTRTRMPDEEDENEIIFGGDDDIDTAKPKYSGVVVAVLERAQNQDFSGTLTLMRPNNKRAQEEKAAEEARLAEGDTPKKEAPRIVWFKATDKRVPLIAIPIEQAPADFVDNNDAYRNRLFVGSIKRWPITSLHPFGYLERELGQVTDLDVQVMAILADNNVSELPFSDAVMSCLPANAATCELSAAELKDRRDYTDQRMFTIDPAGSNALDDAFSVRKLSEDTFEVGVHVSDVTHYIVPHSAMDKEARARGVRVDLQHKFVPMLPGELTDQVTNLDPGKKRLAISVVWTITSKGKILDTWIGKTVVRSDAQLSHQDAQKAIDSESLLERVSDNSDLCQGVEQDIRTLAKIGSAMRDMRLEEGGAMTQMRDELEFTFEYGHQIAPSNVSTYTRPAAATYMKEFLLQANISVAQKISSHLPEQALCRRQPPPVDRKIRELEAYAARHLGVSLDVSNASTIEHSITSIHDAPLRKLVTSILLKTFNSPKYYCTGTLDILKYSHYALNVPLFTHFTAPSRRYADIIVHRQLDSVLNDDKQFYLDRDTVQKLAQHCNVKKNAARVTREQTSLLFLSRYLCAKQQPPTDSIVVFRDATVVAVFDQYFDVLVPDLNIEKRVHLAHLPVWRSNFDEQLNALTLYWKKGVATPTGHHQTYESEDEDELDEEALIEEMKQEITAAPAVVPTSKLNKKDGEQKQQEQEVRRPVGRRASVLRTRLSDSTGYSTEQSSQTLKALDRIKVAVIVETIKPPPVVRVLAANPFA
ncbi:hypothetical protein BDB00DRAFT_883467 [Zychaea mexicana]|uniref:uncharacterized protein n=1 Tax=Zychaea mexicana TaxID=64656 RepID=UPI0022FE4BB8|nr:uncharacterized protein BDB00DRAFT_883467 [Zychaea mexicana]KAI9492332.1 hypothetical protein BDB00DRAFT_883467 [Zychaea mexicana]